MDDLDEIYEAEKTQAWLEPEPEVSEETCCECGYKFDRDDFAYEIDGYYYCEECMDKHYKPVTFCVN